MGGRAGKLSLGEFPNMNNGLFSRKVRPEKQPVVYLVGVAFGHDPLWLNNILLLPHCSVTSLHANIVN